MSSLNLARSRQQAHLLIRDLMQKGDLDEAHYQAEEALIQFGPHLGLLCDKAACEYEIGYFFECELTFRKIEEELMKAEGLASVDSKRRTYLFLSKVAEELGEYEKTLHFFDEARKLAWESEDLKWIHLQELRVLSYINRPQGLSEKYLLVEEREASHHSLNVETLHSLMWTEWRLFGWSHAELRFQQLLSLNLNVLDARLVNRDFIEICLISDKIKTESALIAQKNLRALEGILPYDEALLQISAGNAVGLELQISIGISKMMRLRILLLGLMHEKNLEIRSELRRKFLFLIESVSKKSREILILLLPASEDIEKVDLELQPSSRALFCKDQQLKLTKLQVKLLSLFSLNTKSSLEELSESLWNLKGDPQTYDRVRMLIYRTNAILEPRMGYKAFMVTKMGVVLDSRIRLKVS